VESADNGSLCAVISAYSVSCPAGSKILAVGFGDNRSAIIDRLLEHSVGQYFVVALQVSQDTQLKRSARGWDNARRITEVLDSFAASAPQHLRLVFKIHPLERCDDNDRKLLDELSVNLSIIVIAELSSATAISSIMMISRRCGSALQRLDLESRPFRPDFCFRWQVVSLPFL